MSEPDFHETIQAMIKRGRASEWLRFERMACYIRVSQRTIDDQRTYCIVLANLNTERQDQRKGCFTRLVGALGEYRLPLLLENVLDKDWQAALIARHGWQMFADRGSDWPCDLILRCDQMPSR